MWLVVIDQWSSEPGRLTLVYNSSFLHRDVSLKLYLQSQNLYKLKYSTEFSSFINHSLSFYSRHVERHMACADCFKVIIFWQVSNSWKMELLQIFGSWDQEIDWWFTCWGGGGVWTNYQIFEMRDLTGPQFLEGVGGKEGGDLFQEVSVFI